MNEIYKLSKKGELRRVLVPPITVPPIQKPTPYGFGEKGSNNPSIYYPTGLVMSPREVREPAACDEMENKESDENVDNSKKEDNEKKGLFGKGKK